MLNPSFQASFEAADDFVSAAIAAIRNVNLRGSAIDLRAAESDKSEKSHEALLRAIEPLLDEALSVIGSLQSYFERDGGTDGHDELADICALAGMVLKERRARLVHSQPCDHWTYLENCERSLRSLAKSGNVVVSALARSTRVPEPLSRATDLGAAIRVRRRYAALRAVVARARTQTGIESRLRAVSKGIAALLGSDEYPLMRLGDRRELRMLQFRIQSWLSTVSPEEIEGRRTWEELTSVVSLISGISNRSELFAHDSGVVADLAEAIERGEETRTLRELAEPLFGLDAELDELLDIQSSGSAQRNRWEQVVTRIVHERRIRYPAHDSAGTETLDSSHASESALEEREGDRQWQRSEKGFRN